LFSWTPRYCTVLRHACHFGHRCKDLNDKLSMNGTNQRPETSSRAQRRKCARLRRKCAYVRRKCAHVRRKCARLRAWLVCKTICTYMYCTVPPSRPPSTHCFQVILEESEATPFTRPQSISTNGANRPTQRPRVRNVYCWHWLSKRKAKTKKVTSQCLARLGALCGWASFVAGQLSKSGRQRISMDGRSSRDCLSATGHAFHW